MTPWRRIRKVHGHHIGFTSALPPGRIRTSLTRGGLASTGIVLAADLAALAGLNDRHSADDLGLPRSLVEMARERQGEV